MIHTQPNLCPIIRAFWEELGYAIIERSSRSGKSCSWFAFVEATADGAKPVALWKSGSPIQYTFEWEGQVFSEKDAIKIVSLAVFL